jgi:hypothetical protein
VEVGLLSTPAKRAEVVEGAVDTALGLLSALGDGLSLVGTPEPDAIVFGAFTTPPAAVKTTFGHSDLVDAYSYGGYLELLRHCASYSAAEQNYRLSRILNQVPAGHVEIFLKNYFENVSFNLASELIHTLGKTIAHEIGHSVGLPHTAGTSDQQVIHYLGDDPTTALADVMAQGEDPAGSRRFSLSANAFRVAVGEQWDEHAGQGAVDYFRKFVQAGGNFDSALGDRDANAAPAPTFGGPVAWLLTGPDRTFVNSPFDLGSLEADGRSCPARLFPPTWNSRSPSVLTVPSLDLQWPNS